MFRTCWIDYSIHFEVLLCASILCGPYATSGGLSCRIIFTGCFKLYYHRFTISAPKVLRLPQQCWKRKISGIWRRADWCSCWRFCGAWSHLQGASDNVQFGRELLTFRRVLFLHLQGARVKSCRLVAIYREHSLQWQSYVMSEILYLFLWPVKPRSDRH
jgi:hypothetical protein